MTIDVLLLTGGLLAVAVAALSERLRRLPVSEPLLGLLAGVVLGPAVSGVLDVAPLTEDAHWAHTTTRLLLAVSVMSVALRYPLRTARTRLRPVALLLAVAMPAMALVTAGLSAGLLGVGVGTALLLGAALSPTDPVLASNVVTGRPAEEDLPGRDRQLLSLESGANDGLALPLVLLAVAVAGATSVPQALLESLWQVAGAAVVGAGLGWLGGRALRAGEAHGATDPGPLALFTAVLAFAVLGLSGLLHVDGILAVFVGGLAFNLAASGHERTSDVPIDEAVNRFLVLPLFVGIGAALPWSAWGDLGWRGVALAAAVLLLRRLPVALLLARLLRLRFPDAVWVGWFGPIGVSALFYLALEAERLGLDPAVLAAGTLVVAASTVVHGVTASPGRVLFRRATRSGDPEGDRAAGADRDRAGRSG
ncbi:cation:proton antiporter [Geodermatophilus sp. YIM 151500]|uniref:cation:proton antiporter domain-containing protein n=1 Tax=Geodermatophilus sp. YIM 151500 TaxID=2984531 RepID=UPI0021E4EFA9|nr:cation:proton antiporter [Geodermatophilus sp. YIM 151500]MCV2488181.1 cation:proton antiporter [Geodermatophilus sp. YIM 151500]